MQSYWEMVSVCNTLCAQKLFAFKTKIYDIYKTLFAHMHMMMPSAVHCASCKMQNAYILECVCMLSEPKSLFSLKNTNFSSYLILNTKQSARRFKCGYTYIIIYTNSMTNSDTNNKVAFLKCHIICTAHFSFNLFFSSSSPPSLSNTLCMLSLAYTLYTVRSHNSVIT